MKALECAALNAARAMAVVVFAVPIYAAFVLLRSALQ